jgi:hypothetical protein
MQIVATIENNPAAPSYYVVKTARDYFVVGCKHFDFNPEHAVFNADFFADSEEEAIEFAKMMTA